MALPACALSGEAPGETTAEHELAAVFSGRVVNAQNEPIAGVRVTINGTSRVTSSTGQYAISVPTTQSGYRFDLRKNEFGPLTEFRVEPGLSLIHRMTRGIPVSVSFPQPPYPAPPPPVVVREPASRIELTIPVGALVRTNGAAAIQPVRVFFHPHTSQTMPGDFTGRRENGQPVALVSVGAVTLQALDAQGSPLRLASGASLQVRLPVPASAGERMPSCVLDGSCVARMWRFDPATGVWQARGDTAPSFGSTATTFVMRAGNIVVSDDDLLGSWNADIEFTSPACMILRFTGIPLECFTPGLDVAFTQALAGGGTKSQTALVPAEPPFVVLYNLRPNVEVDLTYAFRPGTPAGCASAITITSDPGPAFPFPTYGPTGGETRVSTGDPWGGVGYPTNAFNLPITFLDVATDNHPCNSWVELSMPP